MDFISRILNEARLPLRENSEASKNLAVETIQQISETLDLLKNNIDSGLSKLDLVPNQGVNKTKLHGLSAQVDSAITVIAEMIAQLTGMETKEDILGINDEQDLEEDVKMTSDDALKNVDKVKKLAASDVNVVIDDNTGA